MTFLKNISASELPDDDLVEKYKATSDLQVLSDLYQRYMELVYGVCLKYLKDEEEAKDAVINIYEELVGKLQKYPVNNFKPWLYQLAKNHCLMKMRSDKKFTKVQMDVSFMQNEETVHLNAVMEKEEHFNQLDFCMDQLVSEQKAVVTLFYLEGKCYNEITTITGIEWKNVRSFIQNGRRNLKICMDKQISIS
ncbi:MAG: RNA polymerase sigma factor [Ferruginibacter sp.]